MENAKLAKGNKQESWVARSAPPAEQHAEAGR
jgi:hypothetical protein